MKITRIGFVAASLSLLVAGCANEKKPLKVLMIGNSFSVQMERVLPLVAHSLGEKIDIASLYIGGCSLERHMENVNAPDGKPYSVKWSYDSLAKGAAAPFNNVLGRDKKGGYTANIPSMLAADKWDVVTIQQASHHSWLPESYTPFGDQLVATVRKLAPQAEIVVQETWSYTPWDGRFARWTKEYGTVIDQNTMYERLHKCYGDFAAKHNLRVIPTGTAVQAFRKELPVVYTENSFGGDPCGDYVKGFEQRDGKWYTLGDVFHMNETGNYLQALVWAKTLLGVDVTKCKYAPECMDAHPERAELMRKVAASVEF